MTNRLIFFALLLFMSCGSDDFVYEVNPEFEPYVNQFVEEGKKRGKEIDFSIYGLTMQFSETISDSRAGQCISTNSTHNIEIHREHWERSTDRRRKKLIFHELGHCTLLRGHLNEKLADDSWRSIMKGEPFQGYENRNPTAFYGFREKFYLDELFDASTPDPDWANKIYTYADTSPKEEIFSMQDESFIDENFTSLESKYEFEIEFSLPRPEYLVQVHWGATDNNYTLSIQNGLGTFFALKPTENTRDLLHYNSTYQIYNDGPIAKITVRQSGGVEQIFINDAFFFAIDQQSQLDDLKIFASGLDFVIDDEFDIRRFKLSTFD